MEEREVQFKHPVYVEVRRDGRAMAHAYTLPGCISKGKSMEEALAGIGKEIGLYYSWLKSHKVPLKETEEWELIEAKEGIAPFESGDAAELFTPDLEPPEDEEVEEYLRRMSFSRQDLLSLVTPLREEELKCTREGTSRTIEAILYHVARAEEWYISRLGPISELHQFASFQGTVFNYLAAVRRMAVKRLSALSPLERATVYRLPEFTQHPEEPWTMRKVLRRFLEHEREHTQNIVRLLNLPSPA